MHNQLRPGYLKPEDDSPVRTKRKVMKACGVRGGAAAILCICACIWLDHNNRTVRVCDRGGGVMGEGPAAHCVCLCVDDEDVNVTLEDVFNLRNKVCRHRPDSVLLIFT